MSIRAPAPAPSSSALAQERATSSNSLGDTPTIRLEKSLKGRVATRSKPSGPVDVPAPQRGRYRYNPYLNVNPTPESEGNRLADPEDLEKLDATAKMLYKSDREVLKYIEALNHRTAAVLERVNRTNSQLRSCDDIMKRMKLFVGQRQEIGFQWAPQQPLREDSSKGKRVDNKIIPGSDGETNSPCVDFFFSLPKTPDLMFNRNQNPFLTLFHNENNVFPAAEEHLFKYVQSDTDLLNASSYQIIRNTNRPGSPHDHARDVLGGPAPRSPYFEEDDFFRPETPPARQPSLPFSHEDGNVLEYAEDMLEMRSDFSAPPDHAALAFGDSTFSRYGADLRITSDTGLLFPPPDQELARISKELKREAMDTAQALAMRPPTDLPPPRHPLAQSYIPSSDPGTILQSDPEHLVPPLPVLRTPPPSRVVLSRKRKRLSTPEEEEDSDAGSIAGPSTSVRSNNNASRKGKAEKNSDGVSVKRRKLIAQQLNWDSQMFPKIGSVPIPSRTDPPTRESSQGPSSQPAQGLLVPIGPSRMQKEDSDIERSQVIEMLSRVVEQGESEDESEPTGFVLAGLEASRHSLPPLTVDNSQATSTENTQSKLETPAESQVPADASDPTPEDVFGPIVFSANATKISDRLSTGVFEKDLDGGVVALDFEHETANVSSKSTRFNLDGKAEKKEYKVFHKTPIKPGTLSKATEAENALAAGVEAERMGTLEPLPSPKRKRRAVTRARKQKGTPSTEPEPAINPEDGLPSISTSKPPSVLRRGRSATVQPKVPPPKAPVRKPTRSRKKI